MTAISPIHIGSGEVYEPTNFIIDNKMLYAFRDEDFYGALSEINRKKFMQIVEDNASDSFVRIHKFVKENANVAKNIAHLKVRVTRGTIAEYLTVLRFKKYKENR